MQPNPVLKKLGFADDDRVVIIHTDDIGMCQASVEAYSDLWEIGLISSGATMVPCPWFPEAAAFCRDHPEVDMGVHLTLTSEWQTYRWGPISTRDPLSGLMDDEGFFPRTSEAVQETGDPDAVQVEIEAQIQRAKAAGIAPTHADTHMGSVASARFITPYVQTALGSRLPPMLFRMDEAGWQEVGLDAYTAALAVQMMAQLEADGMPLLDHITGLELDPAQAPPDRIAYAKEMLGGLEPGITHFVIHPSKDTPELRAITPDWPCRVADYEAFSSDDLRQWVADSGIQVIGYRALQGVMPG
jgi:predicted glycoside hydrolase/deacetylase ChbG (UPF0249 family)